MTKDQLIEGAGLYCRDHNLTIEEFARQVGIYSERMKVYAHGDYELTDDDALKLSLFLRLPWELEPKNCPFCGGEAKVVWNTNPETNEPNYAVCCLECGIALISVNAEEQSSGFFSSRWDAVRTWNRRL